MTELTLDYRYKNDVHFNRLVDMLEDLISRAEFTPTEIREACLLAQIKYEAKNGRITILGEDIKRFIKLKEKSDND